jgi:hypothetical protein
MQVGPFSRVERLTAVDRQCSCRATSSGTDVARPFSVVRVPGVDGNIRRERGQYGLDPGVGGTPRVILYAFSRALKIRGSRNYRTGSKSNYRRKGPVPPPVHNRPTSSEVEGCGLASPLGGESEASHEHPTQGGVDPSGKREGAEPHTWAGCIVTWEMQTQLGHNSPFGQAGCGLMTDRPAQDRSSRRLGTSASSPRFCKLHPRLVARCFAPAAPDPRPLAVLRHLHAAWRREQTLQGSARATI